MGAECYRCHRSDVRLVSLNAFGVFWMCADCIREEEKRIGKKGVIFNSCGLDFLTPEEYENLMVRGIRPGRCELAGYDDES